jgi:predicted ATPase/class 3 adenylate cyclase/Tfp pilus assembly protein PilF
VTDQPQPASGGGDDGLPSGTVTFLFTDIAGSTRLLRADRAAYTAALAEHRRLVRSAVAAHGGREVDTQGDSFFVAFPSAGPAVAAAADAQRALTAQTWPADARILVRMGLHSGEATVAGGTYIGLAVHRAARIAAAASGGQVLLSDATAALLEDGPPPGIVLRSLGVHGLKDFPQSARLYQLDISGLPTHFPPPRTRPRAAELPVTVGEMFGRDDDLGALRQLLADPQTHLVTVTGPGGVGKTTLALETARNMADEFPGGVVFVPLSALTDPRLVLSTVADAVGARREPGTDLLSSLREALGDERTLLELDNFEQLVTAGGDLAALLEAAPAAVVMATSRHALRLRAERQFHVAPLAEAAAIGLFAQRAATVRPDFRVDGDNVAVVSEICRRLDGLPLAIELAAARVRLLPPAALLDRLRQRADLLGGSLIDLPERQRTLRATMDWSYALLRSHEQAVFSRLAVFAGGWTLAAAEAVCGRDDEPAVLDALSALLDASLLVERDGLSGEPRLDMLETVRAYAADRLTRSPDRDETQRRHTRWLVSITDPDVYARPRGFPAAVELFDHERANLRAVVQRAIDQSDAATAALLIRNAFPYLVRREAQREVLGWLDQILPAAADAPDDVRGRLLVHRAMLVGVLGDVPAVGAILDEGRPLLPDDGDHALDLAVAGLAGIYAALARGSVEDAITCTEAAGARYEALHQELGVAYASTYRATLTLFLGDLQEAEERYRAALELAVRAGDEGLIGEVLSLLGLVLLDRGDEPAARRTILDAAVANRQAGEPSSMAAALEGLAAVALAAGHADVAARALAATAAARGTVATALFPTLAPLVEDVVARARERLGDQAYQRAVAEGGQWSLLQGLDRTLTELLQPST